MIEFDKTQPINIDLACGDNKTQGYFGVDKYKTESTDYEFDLLKYPWPIEDGIVDNLSCSHFFEHIPGLDRPKFMDECYRVLKPGGKLSVITPFWSSPRSVQDYTHAWPPVCEASFLYFNKAWRVGNKLTHGLYEMKCNFDFSYGYGLDQDVAARNSEYQSHAVKHYNNAATDIFVTLVKVVS